MKKRILSVALAVVMAVCLVWVRNYISRSYRTDGNNKKRKYWRWIFYSNNFFGRSEQLLHCVCK